MKVKIAIKKQAISVFINRTNCVHGLNHLFSSSTSVVILSLFLFSFVSCVLIGVEGLRIKKASFSMLMNEIVWTVKHFFASFVFILSHCLYFALESKGMDVHSF